MTTWSDRVVACPTCANEVRTRIARGAHADRAPHVRDAILARSFHRFACACGTTIDVDATFEYTDVERRQLVLVGRETERDEWRARERQLRDTIDVLALGSPHATAFVHGLAWRVVFGVERLREKLVLADAALDDALVECVKIRALANDPALAEPGAQIVVDEVRRDDTLACLWFRASERAPAASFELPAKWVAAALDDRASLAARFPELFAGGYVDIARLFPPE